MKLKHSQSIFIPNKKIEIKLFSSYFYEHIERSNLHIVPIKYGPKLVRGNFCQEFIITKDIKEDYYLGIAGNSERDNVLNLSFGKYNNDNKLVAIRETFDNNTIYENPLVSSREFCLKDRQGNVAITKLNDDYNTLLDSESINELNKSKQLLKSIFFK